MVGCREHGDDPSGFMIWGKSFISRAFQKGLPDGITQFVGFVQALASEKCRMLKKHTVQFAGVVQKQHIAKLGCVSGITYVETGTVMYVLHN